MGSHGCAQIEKEVSEAMLKSLKHCDLDAASARQPLCQYRAATIHHRLASMYHSGLRNQVCSHNGHWPAGPQSFFCTRENCTASVL